MSSTIPPSTTTPWLPAPEAKAPEDLPAPYLLRLLPSAQARGREICQAILLKADLHLEALVAALAAPRAMVAPATRKTAAGRLLHRRVMAGEMSRRQPPQLWRTRRYCEKRRTWRRRTRRCRRPSRAWKRSETFTSRN